MDKNINTVLVRKVYMLNKSQLEKYSDVLIWALKTARSKPFRSYDIILIRYERQALPLAGIIYRKLIQEKFNVILRGLSTPSIEKDFFACSDIRQRKFIGQWEDKFYNSLSGNIYLSAPESLTHLKDIDPKRLNDVAITRQKLRKITERREEQGYYGWTLCTYPTEEPAARAKLSNSEYSRQIIKACFLNAKDPVAIWKKIYLDSIEIKKWLNSLSIKTLHIESKSCDLTINIGEKRRFIGISGHNIPSFEIFTSPDWRGTRGKYYANLPSYKSGNYVEGILLEFDRGNVINAAAKKGEKFLKQIITMDTGAKRIGEFSLTDRRFSKIDTFMADTLFDENFGGKHGNCHIAIGTSYSDTYTGNPAALTPLMKKKLGLNYSALHWDIVNTEDKTVTAKLKNGNKILLYEDGLFKY